MQLVSAEYLREALDYAPQTGELRWRVRPRSHFLSEASWKSANSRFAGKVAGSVGQGGYRFIRVNTGLLYGAHRIAFVMTHGYWPEQVDHINGVSSDNRISNLRACDQAQNAMNRKRHASNRCGFKGVSRPADVTRWQARIQRDGKSIHLGMFDSAEAAHEAYVMASLELHGTFARAA